MKRLLLPVLLGACLVVAQGTPRPATPAQQRLSAAKQAYELSHTMYRQGSGGADAPATWSLRLYETQKDAVASAAQEHLERMVALEKLARERVEQGTAPALDLITLSYFRAQAEQLTLKK